MVQMDAMDVIEGSKHFFSIIYISSYKTKIKIADHCLEEQLFRSYIEYQCWFSHQEHM